jgi:hypothetical protein
LAYRDTLHVTMLQADKAGWNRFLVRVKGDSLTVERNGKVIVDNVSQKGLAPSGPIGFRATDSTQFRNLFIRELK